jgi:hypothetical protein
MWIVHNTLKATLTLRGLDVSIPAGEKLDLDVALGRAEAEASNQIQVAFEEGYLQNVYKGAEFDAEARTQSAPAAAAASGVSAEHFDARMEDFKTEFLTELRAQIPLLAGQSQLDQVREAISADMQSLVGELKGLRSRIGNIKERVEQDGSLSNAEVKARLAFLEEQERELLKNFESVGKQVETEDGDVMDMADMLSEL